MAAKLELVRRDFDPEPFTGPSGKVYPVFTPHGRLAHRAGPPVLLLHEMPALNAETLELAERIASRGYRVYVPLLFGELRDNPQDKLFALRHTLQKSDDPLWLAAQADVHRPILEDLSELARKIVRENPGRRLGVVAIASRASCRWRCSGSRGNCGRWRRRCSASRRCPFPRATGRKSAVWGSRLRNWRGRGRGLSDGISRCSGSVLRAMKCRRGSASRGSAGS